MRRADGRKPRPRAGCGDARRPPRSGMRSARTARRCTVHARLWDGRIRFDPGAGAIMYESGAAGSSRMEHGEG